MKKEDYKGFDLCVLGSSDHTVITYGTFGLWGALLSRGDTMAAKGTNKEQYSWVQTLIYYYYYFYYYYYYYILLYKTTNIYLFVCSLITIL